MLADVNYGLTASWGPRRETPAALAQRWLTVVRHLQTLDPALANWYRGVDDRGVPMPLEAGSVETIIAADNCDLGYRLNTESNITGLGPRVFEFDMHAGDAWSNIVTLGNEIHSEPDPAVLRYELFRSALLAIAEIFEAACGYAYSGALCDLWPTPAPSDPWFPTAWMSYVAPHLAPLVTPPPTAIVERRPNGGLLMVATVELFDADKAAHMAVARDIERAVTPLNGARRS